MEKTNVNQVTAHSCLNCQFHHTVFGADKQMTMICRRRPAGMVSYPAPMQNRQIMWMNNILWPIVGKEDWCGEFERERLDGRVTHERIVDCASNQAS